MYKVLISIASNIYAKSNIDRAMRMIRYDFPDASFTSTVITVSDDSRISFPIRNVLGVFYTDTPLIEVSGKLKTIEFALGKQSHDKESGKIVMNINLIQYDEVVIRTEDLEKDFVQKLLIELEE